MGDVPDLHSCQIALFLLSRVDILFMQYATKSSARANNRGFIFQADMTGSTAHVLTCKVEIRRLRNCL